MKTCSKTASKSTKNPEFVHTDSDDSGTKDEQEPAVKQPQKAPKTPKFVDIDSDDLGDDDPMVKRLQTLPKKVTLGKESVLPVVKQPPELIEAETVVLEDSCLEITLSDLTLNYPIDDSIRVSVEGMHRSKKYHMLKQNM